MALATLVLVAGVAGVGMSGRWTQASNQIYTPAQLQTLLAKNPRAWVNRQVLVQAIGGGCIPWAALKDEPCVDEMPALVLQGATGLVASLPLVCGQMAALPRFARQLPWLRRWLPAPQILYPGKLWVYHIQLPAVPAGDALLLESLPSCGPA
jgi:hypothetical protein